MWSIWAGRRRQYDLIVKSSPYSPIILQTVPAVVRLPPTGPPSSQVTESPLLQAPAPLLQVVGPPASPPPQPSGNIFIGSPSLEPEEPAVSVINNDDARLNGESRNTKVGVGSEGAIKHQKNN